MKVKPTPIIKASLVAIALQLGVVASARAGGPAILQLPIEGVTDCTFEIIPYHKQSDVEGLPETDPKGMTPKKKTQSMKWWAATLVSAKKISIGDAITIGYQREKMTITSVYVTHIVGSGSLKVRKTSKDK